MHVMSFYDNIKLDPSPTHMHVTPEHKTALIQ